jgi:hypothetical protein
VKLRRLRDGGDLPDGDVVLIRGGALDRAILRADALRYHDVYGSYGISVFAALGATLEEMSQQVPLVRFAHLTLLNSTDLRRIGFGLEPTGRNPRHYTVSFEDLEKGLTQLVGCAHQVVPNAYFDA